MSVSIYLAFHSLGTGKCTAQDASMVDLAHSIVNQWFCTCFSTSSMDYVPWALVPSFRVCIESPPPAD